MAGVYLDHARELRSLIDENAAKTDGLPIPLAHSDRSVREVGELVSRFRAARGWLHDTFAAAERNVVETGEVGPMDVVPTRQATVFVTRQGADILRRAYLPAGAGALRSRALQRAFRDIHVSTRHVFAGAGAGLELECAGCTPAGTGTRSP